MSVDAWSLCHVASGFVLGAIAATQKLSPCAAFLVVAVAIVSWELFELLGYSRGWSWGAQDWWAHESWDNRWLSDVGLGLLGAAGGYYAMQPFQKQYMNIEFAHN